MNAAKFAGSVLTAMLLGGWSVVAAETKPAASGVAAAPAPIERANVFEFTEKPTVTKAGGKTVIAFASKAPCDATVAIVGPDGPSTASTGSAQAGSGQGKIVRHLASGVLGRNAPAPFQKDTLAQKIEWDGKDDAGKVAPAGCKIRVSLGLKPKLDKLLPEMTMGYAGAIGLACDDKSQLYVVTETTIRQYSKDGVYVRTLLPPPAGVNPERMAMFDWINTTFGDPAFFRPRTLLRGAYGPFRADAPLFRAQAPSITSDGRLALVTDSYRGARKLILVDTKDGSIPPSAVVSLGGPLADTRKPRLGLGRIICCLSPDGKTAYFGGVPKGGYGEPAVQAVTRVALDKPEKIETFAGDTAVAGKDDTHFDGPTGVGCDAAGNVYVCDTGNGRIQVFKPDGSLIKSIAVENPRQVAVHPKSGAVYVLCCGARNKSRLVKFNSLNEPTQKAEMALPGNQFGGDHTMCLDLAANPVAVWVALGGPYTEPGLWRIEDRGDTFAKAFDAATVRKVQDGWAGWQVYNGAVHSYLCADPFREEIYVRMPDNCFPSDVIRADGRTGKVIERLGLRVEQCYMGPDKLLYLRLEDGGEWLARYDPDAKKMVPMTAPEAQPVRAGGYGAKKYDLSKRSIVSHRGQQVIGIYSPSYAWGRTWQDHFGVAPNGDLYVSNGFLAEHGVEMAKENLPYPKRAGDGNLLQVYSPEGKRKSISALPGLSTTDGIRIGRSGAVFAVLTAHPEGRRVPEGLAADSRYLPDMWGTLVKFNSAFDKFPLGNIAGNWGFNKPEKVTHRSGDRGVGVCIENMSWDYPGVAPLTLGGCVCHNSHFDLDLFERSFVPAAQTSSVNVLDTNGNLIMRIGKYGNIDNQGKSSAVIDLKTGLPRQRRDDDPADLKSPLSEPDIVLPFARFVAVTDEAVYVSDGELQRIVRAAIAYAAEEIVPVL